MGVQYIGNDTYNINLMDGTILTASHKQLLEALDALTHSIASDEGQPSLIGFESTHERDRELRELQREVVFLKWDIQELDKRLHTLEH